MIPKTIHYCWFGGNEKSALYKECISSWKAIMPDFDIIEWNESNIDISIPYVKDCLEKKRWAFLSDYIRMVVLRDHGGVYLDVDIEAVRTLDPLLQYNCFLGYEDADRLNTAVVGGAAGHHFFNDAIDLIEKRFKEKKPFLIAPEVANACVRKDASDIQLMPYSAFYPYNPYAKAHDRKILMFKYVEESTYLIHHWGKGWKMGLFERIKRKIIG